MTIWDQFSKNQEVTIQRGDDIECQMYVKIYKLKKEQLDEEKNRAIIQYIVFSNQQLMEFDEIIIKVQQDNKKLMIDSGYTIEKDSKCIVFDNLEVQFSGNQIVEIYIELFKNSEKNENSNQITLQSIIIYSQIKDKIKFKYPIKDQAGSIKGFVYFNRKNKKLSQIKSGQDKSQGRFSNQTDFIQQMENQDKYKKESLLQQLQNKNTSNENRSTLQLNQNFGQTTNFDLSCGQDEISSQSNIKNDFKSQASIQKQSFYKSYEILQKYKNNKNFSQQNNSDTHQDILKSNETVEQEQQQQIEKIKTRSQRQSQISKLTSMEINLNKQDSNVLPFQNNITLDQIDQSSISSNTGHSKEVFQKNNSLNRDSILYMRRSKFNQIIPNRRVSNVSNRPSNEFKLEKRLSYENNNNTQKEKELDPRLLNMAQKVKKLSIKNEKLKIDFNRLKKNRNFFIKKANEFNLRQKKQSLVIFQNKDLLKKQQQLRKLKEKCEQLRQKNRESKVSEYQKLLKCTYKEGQKNIEKLKAQKQELREEVFQLVQIFEENNFENEVIQQGNYNKK